MKVTFVYQLKLKLFFHVTAQSNSSLLIIIKFFSGL